MLEYTAVAFNVAYIILAAQRSIWCWPMGIIGSLISIVLFVEVRIYAEAVLFVYYVGMGAYGWVHWSRSGAAERFVAITWRLRHHLWIAISGYMATALLGLFLHTYTDSAHPYLDSFTTIFSFIATYLVAKKVLENWIYWIAIDSLTVYLYIARDLKLYALLSLVYAGMAIYGYMSWRKSAFTDPEFA